MQIDFIGEKINISVFDKRDSFGFEVFRYPSIHSNIPDKTLYNVYIVNWFIFQGFVTIWKVSFQLVDYLRGGLYLRGPKKIVCLLPLKNSGQIMISNMFPGLMQWKIFLVAITSDKLLSSHGRWGLLIFYND